MVNDVSRWGSDRQPPPVQDGGRGVGHPGSISHRPLVGGADRPKGPGEPSHRDERSGGCRRSFHASAANRLLGHVEDTFK